MDLPPALRAIFTDPSYEIPLVIAVVLAIVIGWWTLRRTAPLPTFGTTSAPETWRLQLDALVYANLSEGRYSAAVDALGRCLAVTVRDRFQVHLSEPSELDDPEANRLLPPPMTLRTLVREINRAYTAAAWAEQTGWLARRWSWLRSRQERKAARNFAALSTRVVRALGALELE